MDADLSLDHEVLKDLLDVKVQARSSLTDSLIRRQRSTS